MSFPTRARAYAVLGLRPTLYQRVANILSPVLLAGVCVYLLVIWRSLPEQIPTHYGVNGQIDGYGGRGVLWIMPVIGIVSDLTFEIVGRFPRSWNTGVRVTVFNAQRVYRLTLDLMADMRLGCAVLFSAITVCLSRLPGKFPGGVFALVTLAVVLIPLIRYFARVRRVR